MIDGALKDDLELELSHAFETLATLTPGTQEYSDAATSAVKLYDLRIEQFKAEQASESEAGKAEKESQQHEEELKQKKLDRLIGIATEAAKFGLSSILTTVWIKSVLQYESNGVVTSKIFGPLMRLILPKNS